MKKNVGPFLAFNDLWFAKNQRVLLWLLNAPLIKHWARWILRIRRTDCPIDIDITEVYANRFSFGDTYFNTRGKWYVERTTDFRTHPKFGKRVYFAFRPVWWALHFWDSTLADRFVPQWSYGFSTLTAFPDSGTGVTTVDGTVARDTASETFVAKISGAGTLSEATSGNNLCVRITSDASSNTWGNLWRAIFLFDTSALGSTATISATVMSLFGSGKADNVGIAPNIDIYTSTPASNNALVNADYGQVGSISQTASPITYAGWSASAYNDFAFNATGRGNISKTGISKFGARNANYDVAAIAPTWVASQNSFFQCFFADNTGTTADPKLVVTYSAVVNLVRAVSVAVSRAASRSIAMSRILGAVRKPTVSVSNAASRFAVLAGFKVIARFVSVSVSNAVSRLTSLTRLVGYNRKTTATVSNAASRFTAITKVTGLTRRLTVTVSNAALRLATLAKRQTLTRKLFVAVSNAASRLTVISQMLINGKSMFWKKRTKPTVVWTKRNRPLI